MLQALERWLGLTVAATVGSARSCKDSPSPRNRRLSAAAALALVSLPAASTTHAEDKWVMAPPNTAAGGQAFGLWMMTDGSVLSHGSALNKWVRLYPDQRGDYSKGTWKPAASSQHARGGAQQHMLKDGRFFQAGGEYVDGPQCTPELCKGAEIYDPVADKWTAVASGLWDIADVGSANLPDGRILDSTRSGNKIQIYDPAADKWTDGGTFPLMSGNENSWVALQNGGILAVGYKSDGAAIYDIATSKWQRTGAVPKGFALGDAAGISLMFDGRVLVYGFGILYIYTPGATGADPGTWELGPKTLMGLQAEDEFSNTLPNGKVWSGMVEKTYGPGVALQEFDPVTNTVRSVTPPPDKGNPYPIGYCNLPNGQVMATAERNNWIYIPDTQPLDEWRPVVHTVDYDASDKTYTLTGTQLSGLINGSDEGDDMTNAQNYPIVWLKDDLDNVYYCRSFNFSNLTPSKGDALESCQFVTPADLPEGQYSLYVSAVGVQSKNPVNFTVGKGGKGDPATKPAGAAGSGAVAGAAGSGANAGASGTTGTSTTTTQGSAGRAAGSAATSGGVLVNGGGAGKTGTASSGQAAGGAATDSNAGAASGAAGDKSGCGCRVARGGAQANGLLSMTGLFGLAAWRLRRRKRVALRARAA